MKINKCPDCKARDKPKCVQTLELLIELKEIRKTINKIIRDVEK
jgi:hypothetical protein